LTDYFGNGGVKVGEEHLGHSQEGVGVAAVLGVAGRMSGGTP
jgi:hypothetical protein